MIIIQKTHQIKMKTIKIQLFRTKKIEMFEFANFVFLTKKKIIKQFRKRKINVYAKNRQFCNFQKKKT